MIAALDSSLWWAWFLGSGHCLFRGTWILLNYRPAKARLLHNGYRRARRERLGAVFHKEIAPMPLFVEDLVLFTAADGVERRVTLTRIAVDRPDTLIVWYKQARPAAVSAMSPLHWYGLMLAISFSYAFWRFG